jgi:hypothetical protein
MKPNHNLLPRLSCAVAVCAMAALLSTATASAAGQNRESDAKATYQRDRAACMSGQSNQDRATCLREAGAAMQEAQRGRLENRQDPFEQNRLLRCDSQPAADRQDCLRRMNGEGTTSGSVQGGGIYRELVVPETVTPVKSD